MTLSEARKALNPREATFVHGIIDGMTITGAYLEAFKHKKPAKNTAATEGSKLLKKPKILAYKNALEEKAMTALTYTRQKKRERLYLIGEAIQEGVSPGEQIQAIKVDNDMTGDNKPVRVEGEITLKGILDAMQPTTGLPNTQ